MTDEQLKAFCDDRIGARCSEQALFDFASRLFEYWFAEGAITRGSLGPMTAPGMVLNANKELGGADTIEFISGELQRLGLWPDARERRRWARGEFREEAR